MVKSINSEEICVMEGKRGVDGIYRIIVVEPNWIGDVIFTTPAIRLLKKRFPDSYLSCWCVHRVAEVLKKNPYVDEVLLYDERKWYFSLQDAIGFISQLSNRRYDIGILLHPSLTKLWMLKLGRTRCVVAANDKNKNKKMLGADVVVDIDRDSIHRVDYTLALLKAVGVDCNGEKVSYVFVPSEQDRNYVLSLCDYLRIGRNFTVLVPGANWEIKRWPQENFSKLIRAIVEDFGWDVVLAGGTKDIWLCEKIAEDANILDRTFVLAGKLSLGQFGALCEEAKVVVGNDTGPIHVAAAVTNKVIAIFGPTSPKITGLYGDLFDNNLFVGVGCEVPCYVQECDFGLKCMKAVTVDMVVKKIHQVALNGE